MSTNDMILVLDNGAAATSSPTETATEIDEDGDGESDEIFKEELTAFSVDLVSLVVRDGEVQRILLPSPLM
jgi:N-acetylglutamate synthase/N-acetylornithine aminotransferase